jgi:hypothetical protein
VDGLAQGLDVHGVDQPDLGTIGAHVRDQVRELEIAVEETRPDQGLHDAAHGGWATPSASLSTRSGVSG